MRLPFRPGRAALVALMVVAVSFAAGVIVAQGQGTQVPTTFPTVQGQPFSETPSLVSANGVLAIDLRVTATTYTVAGTPISGKAYDGRFIGPTLRVKQGDRIEMTFRNDLDQPTNIHFHGFRVSPSGISDNVLRTIPARTTAPVRVDIPKDMEPGTYWYHSHQHGISEGQVIRGLAGVDRRPRRSALPAAGPARHDRARPRPQGSAGTERCDR